MFHLYLFISCVSSLRFPAALNVLVFRVPVEMLSLTQIFDAAPSWYMAEGAVLVNLRGDRSGVVWLLVFIIW